VEHAIFHLFTYQPLPTTTITQVHFYVKALAHVFQVAIAHSHKAIDENHQLGVHETLNNYFWNAITLGVI
jgi:hypothetical protein